MSTRRQNYFMSGLILFLLALSAVLQAISPAGGSSRQAVLREQMILMGVYLYGLSQERAKEIPASDEITFLTAQMIDLIEKIRETKEETYYHQNLDELTRSLKDLKRNATAGAPVVKPKIEGVIAECANCHRKGAGP